jgi:hypothetical protein
MQKITTTMDLKEAILLLEEEQGIKGRMLKDQLIITFESLKPINLIKNTLKQFSSTPNMAENISGTALGLLSGFLSRKIFVGASGSIIRKVIGSFLQLGVTNAVAQNSDVIKTFGMALLQHFILKKEMNSKSRVR